MSCGSNACASGTATWSTSEQNSRRRRDPRPTGQVDGEAPPGTRPDVGRGTRSPDTAATDGSRRTAPRSVAWKMSLVPLPWCTSQSRIITRSRPRASSACRRGQGDVVEQAEAHRARRHGVMARRAMRAERARRRAVEQQVDHLHGPAGGVQRGLEGVGADDRVDVERSHRRSRTPARSTSTYGGGMDRLEHRAVDTGADETPLEPEPVARRQARARSRRSAPRARDAAPVSCAQR